MENHENDRIAEKHVILAKAVAKRFVGCYDHVDDSDAFGNALLALVEASRTWLPSMDVCFSTYARRCMFNALISIYRKELTHRLPIKHVCDECIPSRPEEPAVDPALMDVLLRAPDDPKEACDHQMVLDRFLEGKSYMEIGKARKISAMSAWNAVRRGIIRIRRDHAGLLSSDCVAWNLPEGDL